MRELIGPEPVPARIQDPFSLRTFPQVHGALMDRLAFAEQVIVTMAQQPVGEPDRLAPSSGVAHHGAFHAAYLVQSLDSLVLAVAQSAQLSLARLTMLAEPAYTGLHPFLGDGTPAASGVMIVEYSAASALAELRALATPAGIQAVTLSRGVEEDASFATLAAQQALEAVSRFRAVLAAELVASLRCLRMQGAHPPLAERGDGLPRRARRRRTGHARPRPDLRPAPRRGAGRRAAGPRGAGAASGLTAQNGRGWRAIPEAGGRSIGRPAAVSPGVRGNRQPPYACLSARPDFF